MRAHPFLKWAGGKARSLERIRARLPERIRTYYEPFVGGGAVFFALAETGAFKHAIISDTNPELIATYRAIRNNVEGVIRALRDLHPKVQTEERYYQVRADRPRSLSGIAARMIYLNKLCYNGLYRVNRSGRFNVPFGKWSNPPLVLDSENLRRCSEVLQGVTITCLEFQVWLRQLGNGDAVYLDPPYVPLSDTSNFSAYTAEGFGMDAQERLAQFYEDAQCRGAAVVLSNSDCRWVRDRFPFDAQEEVSVGRTVSCKSGKRGDVKELLIFDRLTKDPAQ